MQQINSGYRGDSSETLGNIMQGQYAPLTMLNQFTNALTQTAMNNASATNRAAMQLDAQSLMEARRLAQADDQFTLTHALNMDRFDAEEANREFGRQKDIATFNDTMKTTESQRNYYAKLGDAATMDAGSKRMTAEVPGETREAAAAREAAAGKAGWEMRIKELTTMAKLLPPLGEDPDADRKRTAIEAWIEQLKAWSSDPNGQHYLNAFNQSQMSNPLFGMVQGAAQPAEAPAGSPKWKALLKTKGK